MLQHKVNIAVKKPSEKSQAVIKTGEKKVHRRFLRWLLGDEMNILVITPGSSVRSVEIQEVITDDES